ncbi:MAG: redoxin domain-containing protein [Nitrospinae bacterium]|nr:redoxin domain-containing protein [Nitrospinota bacterium]
MNQVVVLAAAAVIAHALVTHFTAEEHVKALAAGDAMPAFTLPLRGGGTVTDKDGLGAPKLYYFYASWCPCSHQSVEKITRAVDSHRDAGLTVLYVGIQDSTEQLEMFLRKHNLDVPAVVEGGQSLADISR